MADFLFVLAKVNLVMGLAILFVFLLRRPVRAAFHASVGYTLWLLVPAMMLASLLPPRTASNGVIERIRLETGDSGTIPGISALQNVPHDWSWIVVMVWLAGTVAMALYFWRLQRDFHCAERAGLAGPAVTGFIKPRIVLPVNFAVQFNAAERAAIIAHEQAHLMRQDARVNVIAAMLRCLCWFNPLIHLASISLRRDQELACDAVSLRTVSRLDYANALLKAQMPITATPLGCAWPGSEHPLTERIGLLKCPAPSGTRRRIGSLTIALLVLFGGVAAWAQQEPVSAFAESGNEIEPAMTDHDTVVYRHGKPVFVVTLFIEGFDKPARDNRLGLGAVRMKFPFGSASSTRGYENLVRTGEGHLRATGVTLYDVKLNYGKKTLRGKTLTLDADTGMLALDGKQMPSGIPPRPGNMLVLDDKQSWPGIMMIWRPVRR